MNKSKVKYFEDLEVWQQGKELALTLGDTFYNKSFRNYSFQDQIMRAALSVSNNVAEGFERQSDKEFVRFLYIAKGSCGEVRSMLHIAKSWDYLDEEAYSSLVKKTKNIAAKLHNLISYLSK